VVKNKIGQEWLTLYHDIDIITAWIRVSVYQHCGAYVADIRGYHDSQKNQRSAPDVIPHIGISQSGRV